MKNRPSLNIPAKQLRNNNRVAVMYILLFVAALVAVVVGGLPA